jgi:hypothetical protein
VSSWDPSEVLRGSLFGATVCLVGAAREGWRQRRWPIGHNIGPQYVKSGPSELLETGPDLCRADSAGLTVSGWQDLNLRPLDPQEAAAACFPRLPAVLAAEAWCVTFTHAQVVQHRALRVVPSWSQHYRTPTACRNHP